MNMKPTIKQSAKHLKRITVAGLLTLSVPLWTAADPRSIIVQSTTSTANSGLYEHLLPLFEKGSDRKVKVVAVGTGQAIRNATNCDADVLLVHARAAEEQFVRDGYGDSRHNLMYNDFIIVGPSSDSAKIQNTSSVIDALRLITETESVFVSRGDDSGTHKKELVLWQASGIEPTAASGAWYRETGSGMGSTLNIASGMNAYTLTDRATWISFKNKGSLKILLEGDDQLHNQYGIIRVSKTHCPNVNVEIAEEFVTWMLSAEGQNHIANFTLANQQLFFPNANLDQ